MFCKNLCFELKDIVKTNFSQIFEKFLIDIIYNLYTFI